MSNYFIRLLIAVFFVLSLPEQAIANSNLENGDIAGSNYRDLGQIIQSGKLRILHLIRTPGSLSFTKTEQTMLERYAKDNNLTLEWIPVSNEISLLPTLVSGAGDVVIGYGQSLAGGIENQARFTLPWITSRQQVVVRADTSQITSQEDLALRQVALKRSSPVWNTMLVLARNNPSMDLVIIPERLSRKVIMNRVASGQYDVTVMDSDFLDAYLPQHPELSAAYDLSSGEARAWAVNTNAQQLQDSLNQFLNKNHLEFNISQVHLDDLPKIKERSSLRLITYSNPLNCYYSDGRFYGFEYELIRKFARSENMRVDVVLANSHEEMKQLLLTGEGDIIAASLPVNSIKNDNIQFATPYNFSVPLVITRDNHKAILDVRDLQGKRIILSAESPYQQQLGQIRARGINFDLVVAKNGVNTEQAIKLVAEGEYDLTVVDSNHFNHKLATKYSVQSQFPLSEPTPQGWAVRSGDVQLLTALNEFVDKQYRKEFYNALYAKYVKHPHKNKKFRLLAQIENLSPYDGIVRKYAEKYSFDWRLIVAQMYQESGFNPAATSHAGAAGLMQIMPVTAKAIGANDLRDPVTSIKSGVKYLGMLRDQFEDDLLLEDRTWFSLASYNAGFGRVKQAREKAVEMGLDPNRWFGNVEKAMLELAKPYKKDGKVVRKCRCGETVVYVYEIRTLYNNYVRLTQASQLARTESATALPYDI